MLRCPNCSAPIDGKARACEYCSADFAGLEKHAEVEWPLRAPEAEALVALDLRCPSELPLDPVRKVLEDLFVALVVELGPGMSLSGVQLQLRRRLAERLDAAYQLQALRVTAFTPVWRGGKTERRRSLFEAERKGPTSKRLPREDGVREELVAPLRRRRPPPEPVDLGPLLLHLGLGVALAAIVGVAIAIGVWVSHHLMLTILLALGAIATVAIVWGVRRDRRRKRTWDAFLEQKRAKRAASGRVAPAAELRAPAPQVAGAAPEPPAPADLAEPARPTVKLSAPKLRAPE
ncbi:MAG: hypothetical protein R3F62_17145 [Planctomycetota bacterium]